jgi:hypothetical protein
VIRQFDIVKNPKDRSRDMPFLLVLQHDLLDAADTIVVAPLSLDHQLKQMPERMMPIIVVAGKEYRCVMHLLAAVPRHFVTKVVANAREQRDAIVRAYDVLIAGV